MTTPAKEIVKSEDRIEVFMRKPETIEKFEQAGLGPSARSFISSVLILVNTDPKLQECSTLSIYRAALQAASLELSVDPETKQGWIIPYDVNVGTYDNPKWVKQAKFRAHYNGLRLLAERTGKYWVINVSPVYKGERVIQDRLTGLHYVVLDSGLVTDHPQVSQLKTGYKDVTNGTRELERIGYLGYYKNKNGIERTVWMTLKEIDDHARKYVKGYADEKTGAIKNPNWKDPVKRQTMEMKTVLRQLLSSADLTGKQGAKLATALNDDFDSEAGDDETTAPPVEAIDASIEDVPELMNIDDARKVQFNGKALGNMDAQGLNNVYLNTDIEQAKEAARIILKEDFRMDPPKKSPEQIQKELGY